MYLRQKYFTFLIIGLTIMGCQKLVNDPGGSDANIEVDKGISHWGGTFDDFGHAVVQTADGGYAVVGSKYATATQQDLMLVKFSASMEFQNETNFGGADSSFNNIANDLQQTADGGYILVGSTFNGSNYDVWVVKYASDFTLTWQDTIKGDYDDIGNSVHQTQDGGFLVCGTSYDGTDNDIVLWKLAADGNTDSTKVIYTETTDNNVNDIGNYAQQTNDGGYVLVGSSYSAANAFDIRLIKLNSSADTTAANGGGFDTTYSYVNAGGYNDDHGIYVQQTVDNGFIVVGNTYTSGWGQSNIIALKTDYLGRPEGGTMQVFGGAYQDEAHGVRQTQDGGFIIVGSKYSQNSTMDDVWTIKLTNDLSKEWDYTYGGENKDVGSSINQTSDGGYIITGNTYSYGNQSQIILLKISGDGIIQDLSDSTSTN